MFPKKFHILQEHSETVLDSSEVSTENGRTSRFPKPEMEIQFTPLQPNKMEVKHQGSALPVTIKMLKTRRKRKSDEMDEVWPRPTNKVLCSFSMYYCDTLLEIYYLILNEITEVYKYLYIREGWGCERSLNRHEWWISSLCWIRL